jgi:predicted nucleotidyltransferase
MSTDERSFRHLLPDFRISLGMQVVLRVDKMLEHGTLKPRGSAGVVVESPDDNREPYFVRFADGQTMAAYFQELSIRKKEVDDQLVRSDFDLRPWIIYRCQVGSRAFGLATESSDDDVRGIFLPPARLHWSLNALPEQVESSGADSDEVFWELEKFVRLALKANPNVLETLWTPKVLHADEIAQRLRSIRNAFLSRLIYQTYSGYVLSQFRRMANGYAKTGSYKPKHAMHLIRLLHSDIAAVRDGEIRIDVAEHREELLAIRAGTLHFEQAKARALELDAQFQVAFRNTTLPEHPDFAAADEFLIWARRRMVDA